MKLSECDADEKLAKFFEAWENSFRWDRMVAGIEAWGQLRETCTLTQKHEDL